MDTKEKIKILTEAAKNGDIEVQYILGTTLINHNDEINGVKWIARAAEQGNNEALVHLGIMYEDGKHGVSQSYENAVKCYLSAAKNGYSAAIKLLNDLVTLDRIAGEKYSNVLEFYLSDENAYKYYIGMCYEKGIGTDVDMNKAIGYFKELLLANDEKTYNHIIHVFYDRGDTKTVLYFAKRASDLFNSEYANEILGKSYKYGLKELRDDELAFKCFSKVKKCRADVARCYYTGEGVEQDISKAISIYEELIEEGDKSAKYPYQILTNLQGRSILTIRDITEIDIAEVDDSEVGAIQITPEKNVDRDSHILYSLEDYRACVDIINNQILNDVEQNNGSNELEIFLKICTKLSAWIKYDEALQKSEDKRS